MCPSWALHDDITIAPHAYILPNAIVMNGLDWTSAYHIVWDGVYFSCYLLFQPFLVYVRKKNGKVTLFDSSAKISFNFKSRWQSIATGDNILILDQSLISPCPKLIASLKLLEVASVF